MQDQNLMNYFKFDEAIAGKSQFNKFTYIL